MFLSDEMLDKWSVEVISLNGKRGYKIYTDIDSMTFNWVYIKNQLLN